MGDDEADAVGGGVVLAGDVQTIGLQTLHHFEVELCRRGVVQHVPRTEQQLMLAVVELRDAEAYRTVPVVAELIREIAVQVIGLRHVSVDDQFQVVSDAAA